jgi:hypothetical protein
VNLAEAEQWADPYTTELDPDHPFVVLMANYHHMQLELERLTAVIARYEAGARAILDKCQQEVKK